MEAVSLASQKLTSQERRRWMGAAYAHFAVQFLASWALKSLTIYRAIRIPEPER